MSLSLLLASAVSVIAKPQLQDLCTCVTLVTCKYRGWPHESVQDSNQDEPIDGYLLVCDVASVEFVLGMHVKDSLIELHLHSKLEV